MKKLLLLFVLSFLSCGNDDSNNYNDVPDGQYFFEIEFGDEVHRIQGNNLEMFTNGSNQAGARLYLGDFQISFGINDISASDYISGEPINLGLIIENPKLGANSGALIFSLLTTFMNNYADQKNISLNSLFVENNPNLTYSEVYANALNKRITNIMLTDLGTPPSFPTLFDGNNVKGSYEGILYFMDNDAVGGSNAPVNIPVPIRISFSIPRFN